MRGKIIASLCGLALLLSACAPPASPTPTATRMSTATVPPASATLPAPAATDTPIPTPTETPAVPPTATETPAPSPTASPTPVPTYVEKLRGEVIVGQAVCHYGPGKPYLYKYGVVQGSNLEIIARDERGIYVEVQAIGGNNPCWVKAEYMKIKGDVMSLKPLTADEAHLPMSPYYGPVAGVSARREGNSVIVGWTPLVLKAGDDSEQADYLIEAWVCQGGQLLFTPLGYYETTAVIEDEPGCDQPSHARLYGVEKHGYTRWIEIPWPQAQ